MCYSVCAHQNLAVSGGVRSVHFVPTTSVWYLRDLFCQLKQCIHLCIRVCACVALMMHPHSNSMPRHVAKCITSVSASAAVDILN